MRPSLLIALVLACTSSTLAIPAPRIPPTQFRLQQRDGQSISGAIGNNVVNNAAQGNTVQVQGLQGSAGSQQNVNAAVVGNGAVNGAVQQNVVGISGSSVSGGNVGYGAPQQQVQQPAAAPAPAPEAAPAPASPAPAPAAPAPGAPAPVAVAPAAIQNGDTNIVNKVNSNTINNSQTDNTAATVAGNQVSGGIQKNSATTQNNSAQGNNTIVGSVTDSHDTINDHRNIDNRANVTVYDTTFHNQNETNFINNQSTQNLENKTIVTNNVYNTVQQQAAAAAAASEAKPQIYYIQAPGGAVQQQQYVPNANTAAGFTGNNVNSNADTVSPPPQISTGKSKQAYAVLQKIKALNEQVMDLALQIINDA
ncbi:hypothetical protein HDU97_004135 [Phlyctochytrium planicorne]|nr:hypothetical protein HDU97_004135 [Phlyctochytrium planicorne]